MVGKFVFVDSVSGRVMLLYGTAEQRFWQMVDREGVVNIIKLMVKTAKKSAKTVRKVAVRATKKRGLKSQKPYTYDTPMSIVAKKSGIQISVPPDMKAGDFLKSRGLNSFARILKMLYG